MDIFTDADWAGVRSDRKSTSGCVVKVADRVIAWLSQKQAVVALSTMEAEFIAALNAVSQANWVRQLVAETLQVEAEWSVLAVPSGNGRTL